jgi:hypothetical protein
LFSIVVVGPAAVFCHKVLHAHIKMLAKPIQIRARKINKPRRMPAAKRASLTGEV